MDGVSAESNAQFIAFRRLVYSFSEQVSREECQAIVYIRLYRSRERYKASSTLEVLSRLEADGVFGPTNPQGLLEITKDIKRQDLASEVKDFIKKRSKSEKKASGGSGGKKGANLYTFQGGEDLNDDDTEEDLQLRATIEVTLAQATVLMQQVEILERAVAEGKAQRQRAKEAIAEAGQTAAALADRLRKAQDVLGLGAGEKGATGSLPLTVPGRSFHAEDQQPFYSNIDYPGDSLGTISHSAPLGVAGHYALQPLPKRQQRRPLNRIPEQCTEAHGKSEAEKTPAAAEEEEDDDYEKMVSFVGQEEEVKAWRMSLFSQGSGCGSFEPSALHPRSSVQFTSSGHALRHNPPPVVRAQSEQKFRPTSYSPGSFENTPPPSNAGRNSKYGSGCSASQSCGVATKAQTTYSPRIQSVHNVNTNNSSGNTTTTPPTTPPTHKRVFQRSGENHDRASLQQVLHQQTTTEKADNDGAAFVKRSTHRLPPPPIPQSRQQNSVKSTSESPPTQHRHGSPSTSDGNIYHLQGSRGDELDSASDVKGGKESRNVSLVKARFENLQEKSSTGRRPAVSQKPNSRPVAKPRKHTPGTHTLEHNRSLAKKDQQTTKTLPHSFTSHKQPSLSQLSGASQSSEDDAYTTLHPSGTSTSTLNTGDSGFEDVRPLQRLDQEPVSEEVLPAPPRPGAYTSLLNQRSATFDQDGYSKVNYRSVNPI